MSDVVLATAGHVDHGKTALVAALTGTDTDRLPQEKERGISIELGFAQLQLRTCSVSLIDVPGHERFVRHMVAGAGGVDGFVVCVAADDGVMPQTREHMQVLSLLGVREGIAVVTKADVCDPTRATLEARELLGDDVPVVVASSVTGMGIEDVRSALEDLVGRCRRRVAAGPSRVFVDRVFTVDGAGTVVTGTLWGASLSVGDRVVVHPAAVKGRIRAAQVHDRPVNSVDSGRVALNLAGVSRDMAPRGSVVVAASDDIEPTSTIDVVVEWLATEPTPLRSRRRLQVFHGTTETTATCVVIDGSAIEPGQRGYLQLRCDSPLVAREGDHIVLRSSERRTVAGGTVIDPQAPRHGRSDTIARALDGRARGEVAPEPIEAEAPPPASDDRDPSPELTDEHRMLVDALVAAGYRPPGVAHLAQETGIAEPQVTSLLGELVREGSVVFVGDMWFAENVAARAAEQAVEALRSGPMGVGELRDLWEVGRRHALALAAYCDRRGLTLRHGDVRILRASAR